jgi:hypothetical protein
VVGNELKRLHLASEARRQFLGGMSRTTFWRERKAGAIEVVRLGGLLYVEEPELRAYIDKRRERNPRNDDGPVSAEPLVKVNADQGRDRGPG